jgi:hypothetical protein
VGEDYAIHEQNFEDRDDVFIWMYENQDGRRNMTTIDKVAQAEKVRPAMDRKAKDRMMSGKKGDPMVNLPQGMTGATRDKLAEDCEVSGKTYDAYVKIVRHGSPELVAATRKGVVGASKGAPIAALPKEDQMAKLQEILDAKEAVKAEKKEQREAFLEAEKEGPVPTNPDGIVVTEAKQFATMAIGQLERMRNDDPYRVRELKRVIAWAQAHMKGKKK